MNFNLRRIHRTYVNLVSIVISLADIIPYGGLNSGAIGASLAGAAVNVAVARLRGRSAAAR